MDLCSWLMVQRLMIMRFSSRDGLPELGQRSTLGKTVEQIEAKINKPHNCKPLNREPCRNHIPYSQRVKYTKKGNKEGAAKFKGTGNLLL